MSNLTEEQEVQLFESIVTPIIRRHGMVKGMKIMAALQPIVRQMQAIPQDIGREVVELLLDILTKAKAQADTKA